MKRITVTSPTRLTQLESTPGRKTIILQGAGKQYTLHQGDWNILLKGSNSLTIEKNVTGSVQAEDSSLIYCSSRKMSVELNGKSSAHMKHGTVTVMRGAFTQADNDTLVLSYGGDVQACQESMTVGTVNQMVLQDSARALIHSGESVECDDTARLYA